MIRITESHIPNLQGVYCKLLIKGNLLNNLQGKILVHSNNIYNSINPNFNNLLLCRLFQKVKMITPIISTSDERVSRASHCTPLIILAKLLALIFPCPKGDIILELEIIKYLYKIGNDVRMLISPPTNKLTKLYQLNFRIIIKYIYPLNIISPNTTILKRCEYIIKVMSKVKRIANLKLNRSLVNISLIRKPIGKENINIIPTPG